jgi:hypothetical protein
MDSSVTRVGPCARADSTIVPASNKTTASGTANKQRFKNMAVRVLGETVGDLLPFGRGDPDEVVPVELATPVCEDCSGTQIRALAPARTENGGNPRGSGIDDEDEARFRFEERERVPVRTEAPVVLQRDEAIAEDPRLRNGDERLDHRRQLLLDSRGRRSRGARRIRWRAARVGREKGRGSEVAGDQKNDDR